MSETKQGSSTKRIFGIAGAFVAWVIGSGFATGQEILQFFTSYGYASYGVVIINLIGFLVLGPMLLGTGFEHREEVGFDHFRYFCGPKLGAFYSWLIPVTLVLVMAVLISGAGATLSEYYGLNHYAGAALMAVMVLAAYTAGFERLIKIVGFIGPSIIAFTLLVGVITVIRDFDQIGQAGAYAAMLAEHHSSPNWALSAVLYVSYNFLCGSFYYTALGKTACTKREAEVGAIVGTGALILAIAVTNTAILTNAGDAASLAIPTLFLAKKISFVLGAVFSIFLIMGIFSSCSAMMWTVCTKFTSEGTKANRIFSVCLAVGTFLLGLLPFSRLIGVFYPFIGYSGLLFIACAVHRTIQEKQWQKSSEQMR